MGKTKSSQKKAFAQIKKLNFLIGKWHTQGEILYADPSSRTIRGMDTYEWVSGGAFILHRVDVFVGNKRTEAVEIIGYDERQKSYFMKSFDSDGETPLMFAKLKKSGVFEFGDKKMRSTLTPSKSVGVMSAKWELSENGKQWKPWMEIRLEK